VLKVRKATLVLVAPLVLLGMLVLKVRLVLKAPWTDHAWVSCHAIGSKRSSTASSDWLHLDARTIWIADAHRGDGKRFVVRADEKGTAFLEVQSPFGSGLAESRSPLMRSFALDRG
jgi:hypothetical protein